MDFWHQYEFEFLLPDWTKDLLSELKLNSTNYFETRSKQLKREPSMRKEVGSVLLEDLGRDVISIICSQIHYSDLVSLSRVNKVWNVG
jgi:hypothetical protein